MHHWKTFRYHGEERGIITHQEQKKGAGKKNPFKNKATKPFTYVFYSTGKENGEKAREKRKQTHS